MIITKVSSSSMILFYQLELWLSFRPPPHPHANVFVSFLPKFCRVYIRGERTCTLSSSHQGPVAYPNCRDLGSLANYCHSVEPLFPHLVEGDDKLCFKGLLWELKHTNGTVCIKAAHSENGRCSGNVISIVGGKDLLRQPPTSHGELMQIFQVDTGGDFRPALVIQPHCSVS